MINSSVIALIPTISPRCALIPISNPCLEHPNESKSSPRGFVILCMVNIPHISCRCLRCLPRYQTKRTMVNSLVFHEDPRNILPKYHKWCKPAQKLCSYLLWYIISFSFRKIIFWWGFRNLSRLISQNYSQVLKDVMAWKV